MNGWINQITCALLRRRMPALRAMMDNPHDAQQRVFQWLIRRAERTQWGRKHGYQGIRTVDQYRQRVPVQTYEAYYPYIERALNGEEHLLWPGPVRWFAKSSGTTNERSKYIPVPPDSLTYNHFKAGRDMLALYLDSRPDSQLFTGKSLSIGGSHQINSHNRHSRVGDLSAVLIANMPWFYESHRAPSPQVALMGEWEAKISAMAHETSRQNITSIAGVPTWTVVLLNRIFDLPGNQHRDISRIWPHLEVFFHGAVSFVPYRQQFQELINVPDMRYMETYNASEGFFALQSDPSSTDLLLLLDHGIFYEFIPLEELDQPEPRVLVLDQVEVGKIYALVISTPGGLWRYLIGDTVKFTSTAPYKIIISGRTKHFINAFGEEVVVENADRAISQASLQTGAVVADYTAAPIYFNQHASTGGHQWLVEFQREPDDFERFCHVLDQTLREINSDYDAKRYKDIALKPPVIQRLEPGTFYRWMARRGKLGGQNKVPRLSNNRDYIEDILKMLAETTG